MTEPIPCPRCGQPPTIRHEKSPVALDGVMVFRCACPVQNAAGETVLDGWDFVNFDRNSAIKEWNAEMRKTQT